MLEPGERLLRALLVPLPVGDWVAYRVAMHIQACVKMIWRTRPVDSWETEMIVFGDRDHG